MMDQMIVRFVATLTSDGHRPQDTYVTGGIARG